MAEYERKLEIATKRCDNIYVSDDYNGFLDIFSFTNVNIADSFSVFNFKDSSFLTIGSSCDPVINASYLGCQNHTVVDINPFTKEYFFLKKAGLMALTRKEFMNYLCYWYYLPHCINNGKVFNLESFEKIAPYLKKFDYDSYLFWKAIFDKYTGEQIRRQMFTSDEVQARVLVKTNLYLKDDESYLKARDSMQSVVPRFIENDIYKQDDFGSYDNINLANLAQFARTPEDLEAFKRLIDKLSQHLNVNGTMLVAYLFDTTINSSYKETFPIIFNLPQTMELLKEYFSEFITFKSPVGILWEDDRKPDSAIVFRKQLKL